MRARPRSHPDPSAHLHYGGRELVPQTVLVVIGVRADGQKSLLAVKAMGGESGEAWRTRSNATARWPSETGSPPRNNVSVSASRRNGPRTYVAAICRSMASSETLKKFFSAVS